MKKKISFEEKEGLKEPNLLVDSDEEYPDDDDWIAAKEELWKKNGTVPIEVNAEISNDPIRLRALLREHFCNKN